MSVYQSEMVDMHARGCLEPEVLAAYVDHGLSLAERARAEAHLASCPQCTALLAGVVRTVAGLAPALPDAVDAAEASPLVSWRAVAGVAAAAAAVFAVLAAPSFLRPWSERDTGLVGLAGTVGEHRSVLGRLTGGFPHAPLEAASAGGQDARASGTDRVQLTAGRIRESVGESAAPSRLHELGVSQLFERRYDDAAALLLAASRQQPANARYLNDVATVQLERARLGLRPDDLPRALAAADRARRLDPSLTEAWFNRALAMSALQLTDQARAAWTEYLRRDSASPWAGEARKRLEELSQPTPAMAWAQIEARLRDRIDSAAADAAVRAQATEARNFIENRLITAWADAVLAGGSGDAELDRLRIMAESMMRVAGDGIYLDAVNAIAQAGRNDRALAAAHKAYADGSVLLGRDAYAEALPLLSQARQSFYLLKSPAENLAAVGVGTVAYVRGRYDESERIFARLATSPYPYVVARANWLRGITAFTQGRIGDAQGLYEESLATFERMGDVEQAAGVHNLLSGVAYQLGDSVTEWRHRRAALDAMAVSRSPRFHYATLVPTALSARTESPEAALVMQESIVAAARQSGRVAAVVDSLAQRAATLVSLGRSSEASVSAREARETLPQVRDASFRALLELPVLAVESDLVRAQDPASAAAAAAAAIETAAARGDRARLPQLQLRLAKANLAAGELASAEKALLDGIAAFDETRAKPAAISGIAAFDESWQLYEAAVQLSIRRGDYERAFALAERGRARNVANASSASLADLQRTQTADSAIVALNQFEDELALWVIRQNGTVVVRRPINRADAQRIVARQRDEIRLETSRPSASATLFDEILRPLFAQLNGVARVAFVPDVTYQDVSFAALWDRSTERFAIEKWIVSAAPTAMFASSRQTSRRSDSILVLSPHAVASAKTIADQYASADVAIGAEATWSRLLTGAKSVVHVTAPARRNAMYPSWSQLRLSDEPGRKYSGALVGRDIASRPMAGTALVVLDELTPEESYRTAGTFDLATAFLAAGVPAVLGTLPGADERDTRELMVGFHRQLAQVPAAEALARVQRNVLQQNGRRLGAWTALVIYGSDR